MKKINLIFTAFILLFSADLVSAQTETAQVRQLMKKYKETLESLDVSESYALFTEDSQVLEQGKIEGTYRDYIANHIGPELGHFSSFTFSEYQIEVVVDLPYAFTTESYVYNIVLKDEDKKAERKATATAVLKKIDGEWKIIKTHSSSRAKQ
jgi:uncharacterized protein (TIGR02246 family)